MKNFNPFYSECDRCLPGRREGEEAEVLAGVDHVVVVGVLASMRRRFVEFREMEQGGHHEDWMWMLIFRKVWST